MELLDHWINEVTEKFKNGCPNGFLLKWDRNRFWGSIKKRCRECRVVNVTDFNYSYCNTYEIIPKSLNGKYIYNLNLRISFIVDAFACYWVRYTSDLKNGKVVPISEIEVECDPSADLVDFMKSKGFEDVPSEWYDVVIPNVQLELAEEATLGKCLFDDFE